MSRTKGAKNRIKPHEPVLEPMIEPTAGNPEFNLTGVVPTDAMAANIITDEDRALDRELDRLANDVPPMPADFDPGPAINIKAEKFDGVLLSEHADVSPATTVNELLDQVHLAKENGCDSIEATPALVRHYCRKAYPSDVGYFIFHDIKVYIEGFFAEANKRDRRTTFDLDGKMPIGKVDAKLTV